MNENLLLGCHFAELRNLNTLTTKRFIVQALNTVCKDKVQLETLDK